MREWLSGRASPCQGERREFESRLPLQKTKDACKLRLLLIFNLIWRHSQVVRQSSAKASSPVQIWVAPPKKKRNFDTKLRFFFFTQNRLNTGPSKKDKSLSEVFNRKKHSFYYRKYNYKFTLNFSQNKMHHILIFCHKYGANVEKVIMM